MLSICIFLYILFIFSKTVFGQDHIHANKHGNHSREHLLLVNGLKNEDIVMMITSTAKGCGYYLRNRVIPSSRTWMKLLINVYVIIEDNPAVRFMMRHCQLIDYPSFTLFKCHNEPHYVLTRHCTDDYYDGPGNVLHRLEAF